MKAIDRLIATAENEIGYLEKKSNSHLDDKTANAGENNYTKYNRDLKNWTGEGSLSAQWCQAFVDWCFIAAFGIEDAKKLIYTWTNYTPTGSDAFKKRDRYIKRGKTKPKRGDVIYFYSSAKGRIGHVGIVYDVSSSTVYTIEGNTSGASSLVTNGGGVKKKSYSLSSTYIDGYGSVDYSQIAADGYDAPSINTVKAYKLGDRELYNFIEGPDVKELQEALISLGFSCGSYGADAEFGDCTEMALREWQKANGLEVTGRYTKADHKAMTAALKGNNIEAPADVAKYVEIQNGRQCYVRAYPNTDGLAYGIAHSQDRLPFRGQVSEAGWLAVTYKKKDAWVSGKYAKLVE